jgi:hypothetical protein
MASIPTNIEKLKLVLKDKKAPCVAMGVQCNKPYTCEFIAHCSKEETLLNKMLRKMLSVFKKSKPIKK